MSGSCHRPRPVGQLALLRQEAVINQAAHAVSSGFYTSAPLLAEVRGGSSPKHTASSNQTGLLPLVNALGRAARAAPLLSYR